MDKFVERQNIAHYVELLKAEADPIKREMLERLLAEEKAKAACGKIALCPTGIS